MAIWATGTLIGPYELIAPIGAGGMGEVWKARDTRLDRIVAIKRLKGEHTARFEQEARAIGALNHPHICVLYDIGPDYLVMEYIEGAPLKGPLPFEDAQRLATQIAGALELAHSKGILHRDLKPANVLITGTNAKLLDFGLAKLMANSGSDATQTVEGTVLGTAAYMSPEQAQGRPLDERSDVFSFGAVLYEMLSGQRAFAGASMLDVLNAVVRDEPGPLPSPAADIVKRCLAKQPSERYQSMAEVRAALEQVSAKPAESHPSIAVLPFANMSGDKEQEYFSDGLAEEIINALAQIPGLKVTSRTSAFAFRGKEQDITKIAEALKVRTILEGSVRKAGNRIRITAQLINAADGYHLWSQRYDADMTDVFAVQDEIATAISAALRVKLASAPAATRYKPKLDAYEACLRGRHYLMQGTPEAHAQGKVYFEQAIALDPGYAEPHAELGLLYLLLVAQGHRSAGDVIGLARSEATKAAALSPDEPLVHIVLGAVASLQDRNWKEAGEHFRLAMSHEPVPTEVRGRYCVLYLIPLGRLREAKEEIDKVLESDPLHVLWRSVLSVILGFLDRHEEALAEARKALEINANSWMTHLWMSVSYVCLGRLAEASESARIARRLAPWNAGAIGILAGTLAISGDQQQADELLKESAPMSRAMYYLIRKDGDAAAEWYQKALESDLIAMQIRNSRTLMKPLRESPHWPALAKLMNPPEPV